MEWLAGWPWGLLLIVLVLVLWGYGDAVADTQKIAESVRDKLHVERMAAIEKGATPPDPRFDEALLAYLSGGASSTQARATDARARSLRWGIFLISAGIGWFLACLLTPIDSAIGVIYSARMFGIIPVTLGLGALLHLGLLRRS